MGLFGRLKQMKSEFSDGMQEGASAAQGAPSDEIGTRYRSDLELDATVSLWEAAVGAAYGQVSAPREVAWNIAPFPRGYRPYGGEEGMGGGLTPARGPDVVLAIDVAEPPSVVYLAAWSEMVSMEMTRPIRELWCVTPDDEYSVFSRQRLEQYWHDNTLSRLGFVERGLWGVEST